MKHDSELFLLRKACRSQEQICSQNCSLQIQELQRKEAIEATINYYSSFSSSSSWILQNPWDKKDGAFINYKDAGEQACIGHGFPAFPVHKDLTLLEKREKKS